MQGSGPGGRILKADVEKAAGEDGARRRARGGEEAAPPKQEKKKKDKKEKKAKKKEDEGGDSRPNAQATPSPSPPATPATAARCEVQELTRLQRTVSRRMAESKATAPDFALEVEIDMSLCVELRARLKEVEDKPPSFNDMVVKACANALREHPRVNAAYRDGKFELYSRVNVGVAVAANDALVVPTVFDADKKSLGEISRTMPGARDEGARREDHPAGALGRHVHGVEPRHVRDRSLQRGDQPAAGRICWRSAR